jgi:D-glycerate 3-kinase
MTRGSKGEGTLSRIAALAGRDLDSDLADSYAGLDPHAPADYRALAALLASGWISRGLRFVGLGGGQGAGKSTLGRLIEEAGAHRGRRVAVLSLDDFYFSKARRRELAETVHPLFETRGPPGTHNIERCLETMRSLRRAGEVEIPSFDKGRDDCGSPRRVRGPFDLVLLEGWCVGAEAGDSESLAEPINELERMRDPDCVWRRAVHERLAGAYAEVWTVLDALVYLQVPDLAAVRRWRLQQEESLPANLRLGSEDIDRFVEFYERITLSMMAALPGSADVTVGLAEDHSIARIHKASAPR